MDKKQQDNALLSFNKRVPSFLQPFSKQVNTGSIDEVLARWRRSGRIERSVFLVRTGARGRMVDDNPQNAGTCRASAALEREVRALGGLVGGFLRCVDSGFVTLAGVEKIYKGHFATHRQAHGRTAEAEGCGRNVEGSIDLLVKRF